MTGAKWHKTMGLLKFVKPPNLTPPDRYRFTFPGGHVEKADDRNEWFRAIARFAKDNDITLPEDWQEQAEDQLCRVLPPGWCRYEDGTVPGTFIDVRMTVDDLERGTGILVELATHPDPLVDQAEAERRARICAACVANVEVSGCFSCKQIVDFIFRVKGARKTEADSALRSCGVCKCSNRAQVWVKPELLEKRITPEHREQYALLSHCWKNFD